MERLKQLARGEVMLGGKNFSGGHDCRLVAVFNGDEHGLQRNDGFAGANVALQQAAHGVGCAHVGDDLAKGALLGGSWMEGQDLPDGFADRIGGFKGDACAARGRGGV